MNMATWNWVDWVICGVVFCSVLISFLRGFVRESVSLVTWILAAWVAYFYAKAFGDHVLTAIRTTQARVIVAGAILFFGILVLGTCINYLISRAVQLTGLSLVDRLLGVIFGFLRGVLLICLAVLATQVMKTENSTWRQSSKLIPIFEKTTTRIVRLLPEKIQKLGQDFQGAHEQTGQQAEDSLPTHVSHKTVASD